MADIYNLTWANNVTNVLELTEGVNVISDGFFVIAFVLLIFIVTYLLTKVYGAGTALMAAGYDVTGQPLPEDKTQIAEIKV